MLSDILSFFKPKSLDLVEPFEQPNIERISFRLKSSQTYGTTSFVLRPPEIHGAIFVLQPPETHGAIFSLVLPSSVIDISFNSRSVIETLPEIETPLIFDLTDENTFRNLITNAIDIPFSIRNIGIKTLPKIETPLIFDLTDENTFEDFCRIVDIPFFIRNAAIKTLPEIETPDIFDVTDEYSSIAPVGIVNISFLLKKSIIDGKAYYAKPKADLFQQKSERTRSSNEEKNSGTERQKLKRRDTQESQKDLFNIFDLILPILQPPLGKAFNNQVAFPHDLYPFQVEGVKFLIDKTSALLGDEMGLGKSIQTITASRVLFRKGQITSACVICPKAVLTDWERKFWDWSPELKVIKIEGSKINRAVLWTTPAHVYICTYETLRGDFETVDKLSKRKRKRTDSKKHFDLIILDEIQKTKNPAAGMTKAIREIDADFRWGLSGTPLENGINDLITVCETLQPDKFFDREWNIEQIKRAYKPLFLRRRAKDVLKELPEKITHEIWLDLLPEQKSKYDTAENEGTVYLESLGKSVTLQHVLALITKLKQICNYESESKESIKRDYLKEELSELTEEGYKALIFSQYPNETLKKIMPELQEFQPALYDGSLSDTARNKIVDSFQNDEDYKIMLISLKAGNAGITLTRANYVYHFDMWWNPAVAAQAVGRALRIGQKAGAVFERFLLTNGTIEERIYKQVEKKKNLFNLVVDDLSEESSVSRAFSEDEIFGLFGLKNPKRQTSKADILTLRDMDSLDPFEFENFVGDVFSKMGYQTHVTKKSRDGGVDIYAKYSSPTGNYEEAMIQCKHKESTEQSVGVEPIREIFGVLKSGKKLSKAFVVTNGIFSSSAIEFAQENNVELIDGTKLQELIKRFQ
jgi:superfamily II DNA or RNA helicase